MNKFKELVLREFLNQLLSHEGKCMLAEKIARGESSIEQIWDVIPRKIHLMVKRHVEGISTLLKNPCSYCGTYKLEEDFVGTGYCSEKCYETPERSVPKSTRWLSAVKDIYLGDPVNLQLKAGDRIEFDGISMRSGFDGRWCQAPFGVNAALEKGWFIVVPSRPVLDLEGLRGDFDD